MSVSAVATRNILLRMKTTSSRGRWGFSNPQSMKCSTIHSLNSQQPSHDQILETRITNGSHDHWVSDNNQIGVAFNMAKHLLLKEGQGKNFVFSPLSFHVLLSIIAAASEGPTLQRLLSFLQSKSTDHLNAVASKLLSAVLCDGAPAGEPRISFGNGVWLDQSLAFLPSFSQLVLTHYKAMLGSVDFKNRAVEVKNEVNSWVEKETNGLIKELLPAGSVNSETRVIFANALYFKGTWKEMFDASITKDYNFHLLDGSSVKAHFMKSRNRQFISVFDGFKVLGLPYKQSKDVRRYSMYIFLPNAKNGLPALVEKVAYKSVSLEHFLPRKRVEVGDFRIPRFKISIGFEATEAIKELGVTISGEDFTKMVGSPMDQNLDASSIIHKSFIEVNEEGTKAAAATAYKLVGCAMNQTRKEPIDFVADHPFLFVIREDLTETLLFIGQVLNPSC